MATYSKTVAVRVERFIAFATQEMDQVGKAASPEERELHMNLAEQWLLLAHETMTISAEGNGSERQGAVAVRFSMRQETL